MQYQDKWKMKISLDIYNLTKEIQSLWVVIPASLHDNQAGFVYLL